MDNSRIEIRASLLTIPKGRIYPIGINFYTFGSSLNDGRKYSFISSKTNYIQTSNYGKVSLEEGIYRLFRGQLYIEKESENGSPQRGIPIQRTDKEHDKESENEHDKESENQHDKESENQHDKESENDTQTQKSLYQNDNIMQPLSVQQGLETLPSFEYFSIFGWLRNRGFQVFNTLSETLEGQFASKAFRKKIIPTTGNHYLRFVEIQKFFMRVWIRFVAGLQSLTQSYFFDSAESDSLVDLSACCHLSSEEINNKLIIPLVPELKNFVIDPDGKKVDALMSLYLPDPHFKKTTRGIPDLNLVVLDWDQEFGIEMVGLLDTLKEQQGSAGNFKLGIAGDSGISFLTVSEFDRMDLGECGDCGLFGVFLMTNAALLPVGYISVLLGILYFSGKYFSSLTREKSPGYFEVHREKLEYEELSEQFYMDEINGSRILQIALMNRATESVRRVMRLQKEKGPLQGMVREGIVGEAIWDQLLAAEVEIEQELQDLMAEANLFKPESGQEFIQEASQLVQMQLQEEARLIAKALAQEQSGSTTNLNEGLPDENVSPSESNKENINSNSHKGPELSESDRERLAKELIEEEESESRRSSRNESQKRRKSKGKK